MSTRYNNGSHYENHQRAAELEDFAAHQHEAAIKHNQVDHLTPHELSRRELEHSSEAKPTVGHGIEAFGHAEIAELANRYWHERGCPEGSSDEDWFRAVKELRSRAYAR
jgi:hypothetical protein